jgi:hypothetical protein
MPDRMPVWVSFKTDKIRFHWLSWLCLGDALYGILTIFGRSDGAPQLLLRSVLPVATPLWGGALFAAATLMLMGYSVSGGLVGLFCWGILGMAAAFTVSSSPSSSGWVVPMWCAGWHLLVAYDVGSGLDHDRERRQRA